jgi:hypothetical protein
VPCGGERSVLLGKRERARLDLTALGLGVRFSGELLAKGGVSRFECCACLGFGCCRTRPVIIAALDQITHGISLALETLHHVASIIESGFGMFKVLKSLALLVLQLALIGI